MGVISYKEEIKMTPKTKARLKVIGNDLKEKRLNLGLTRKEVANAVETSETNVQKLELGLNNNYILIRDMYDYYDLLEDKK